ncbi:MAG: hypothetical protein ACJ0QL_02295 [Parvicellaceae bacterium]
MDTKVQNIVLKSITALIIFLGVLFTVWVMSDDNPAEMSYEQQEQWAIKEAKDQKLNETLSSVELNQHITQRTGEIAEEKSKTLWGDVSLVIGFTNTILVLAVLIVLGGFVYLFIIDSKKALRILSGIGIFALLMVIVYFASSSDVPAEMISSEVGLLEEEKIHTPENWKIASAAINATGILILVALIGWIGGTVVKYFR